MHRKALIGLNDEKIIINHKSYMYIEYTQNIKIVIL